MYAISIDRVSSMIDSTPPTIESLECALRVLEGRLNREISELGGRLDDMSNQSVNNSTDYSDDDQEENSRLNNLELRIQEESGRVDLLNTNVLDRPAGTESLAILRRARSRIDTFQAERNAEFRNAQLERALFIQRRNEIMDRQSSDEDSDDE
eukprot:scaffold5539_cov81-Skeletonema_menzelii.AAC.17